MKYSAILLLSSLLLGMMPCCIFFPRHPLMAGRNEMYSYLGPGSDQVERGKFPKILFAEDSALLDENEKKRLAPVSKFLRENPSARLLLAGFAGEEGTDEYNRVLGEQRAQAVRKYLLESGTSDAVMQTLSYGMDTPGGVNHNERSVQLGIVR